MPPMHDTITNDEVLKSTDLLFIFIKQKDFEQFKTSASKIKKSPLQQWFVFVFIAAKNKTLTVIGRVIYRR